MRTRHLFVLFTAICVSVLIAAPTVAEDGRFATSAEEIVKELTREAPTRGLTRGFRPGNKPDLQQQSIVVREKHHDQVIEKNIIVTETDATPRVNLTIEFDYNSCAIRPDSFSLLDELGRALGDAALAGKPVMIIGHADADGSDAYNRSLSMNRALAVKYYLQGRVIIPNDYIRAMGFGEAMPLVPNTTPENKQKNRRVEVRLDQGDW